MDTKTSNVDEQMEELRKALKKSTTPTVRDEEFAGSGTVIITTPATVATYTPTSLRVTPNYANTTVSSAGVSSGAGLTYTTGTGVGLTPTWSTGTTNTMASGKLNLVGDDADLIINGRSLTDTLRSLEERLNILVPDTQLEEEWAELKQLGEQYRKLEAELNEKAKMWSALKK